MSANGQHAFLNTARSALVVLLGALLFTSCEKPAGDAALDATTSQRKGRETPAPVISATPAGLTPETLPAPPPAPEPDPWPEDLSREAAALAGEFDRTDTDETRRVEVISELAVNGSPFARQTLSRIYRSARSLEVKKEVLEALHLVESEDLEPSLQLLQEAVAAGQHPELRAAAIDSLRDIASPKTIRVWQTLLADRDEEIREAARSMIEFLIGESAR